jgi:hypothetical protein
MGFFERRAKVQTGFFEEKGVLTELSGGKIAFEETRAHFPDFGLC